MKTRVLERAKSNLLLLCASIVTVKNIVLNSYESIIDTMKYPEAYNLLYRLEKYEHQFTCTDLAAIRKEAEFKVNIEVDNGLLVANISANCMKQKYTEKITQLTINTNYSASIMKKIREMGETKESFTNMLILAENQADVELLYNLYEEQYDKVFLPYPNGLNRLSETGKMYLGKYGADILYGLNGEHKLKEFVNAMIKEDDEKNILKEYNFTDYVESIKDYCYMQL